MLRKSRRVFVREGRTGGLVISIFSDKNSLFGLLLFYKPFIKTLLMPKISKNLFIKGWNDIDDEDSSLSSEG